MFIEYYYILIKKDLLLKDLLCEGNKDACIITETWLRDNDKDTAWTQTTVLTMMTTNYTSPTEKTGERVD